MITGSSGSTFATQVARLFDQSQVNPIDGSSLLTGISGKCQIHNVEIKVRISPLRKSGYKRRRRVAANTLGYRQILEIHSGAQLKFSVVHRSISGSWLIKWVNRLKGIRYVPHVVTDLYQYDAWSNNRDWATRLLDDTEANVAITRLLACAVEDAALGHPCVFVTPKRITHFRRAKSLQGLDNLQEDLENLARMARVAEDLAPP